jgi:hypothetical protein
VNFWYYFGSLHNVSGEFFDVSEGLNGSIVKLILVHVFADLILRSEQESVTLKMSAVVLPKRRNTDLLDGADTKKIN